MQVNVLEAKNRLSELLRSAERGEDVVIANRGRGVARLVPLSGVDEQSPVQPGQANAFLSWLEQHPWPQPSARRPSASAKPNAQRHAEIQARIEAQRSGWE
jgi:prevent-host-death family protein